ncbi:hypothetical protein [Acidiphilium sp.]|uniref:hypothetical protein n=1 Tax=Acidiphilium sp. TaxID=527 RepID=UPI0025856C92|nr:hypothetical protein [Acidiphilium sp.]
MKSGRKPATPAEHVARGTRRKDRHSALVDLTAVVEPGALPVRPDDLSADAEAVWADNIGRVSETRLATEIDSDFFPNYCRLQGAINACWRVGEVPPAAHLMEARRMQEMIGIAGARSRIGQMPAKPAPNPFLMNGRPQR